MCWGDTCTRRARPRTGEVVVSVVSVVVEGRGVSRMETAAPTDSGADG